MRRFCLFLVFSLGCSRPETRAPEEPSSQAKVASNRAADTPSAASRKLPPAGEDSLAEGSVAPSFRAKTKDGKDVSLEDLRGKVVVLYFYPKDGTPGCTLEAQNFALAHKDITELGAVLFGVSSDDAGSHDEFAADLGLPFPLIADESGELGRRYGVSSMLGMQERKTFLIDRAGRIAKIYAKVDPKLHADEVLADIRKLNGAAGSEKPMQP
jgi:thioredoxin-dependent peroxiredoxin